jgi:hypothetical protein
MGATRAGGTNAVPMNSPDPQLEPTAPQRSDDRVAGSGLGDHRGKDVSPVISDATGVRQHGGGRGREDATRPRRRYLTH